MANSAINTVMLLVYLGVVVLMIASMWKVFTKAGQPGWAAIVPIYNTYIILKIGDNPWWYLLLLLVPLVNLLVGIKMWIDVAESFGLGIWWGLGLAILPIICVPILAFGDYTYRGTRGSPTI